MQVELCIGNLLWSVSAIQSARVIIDRDAGRSRGFGFGELQTADIATVIQATQRARDRWAPDPGQ